MKYREVLGCKTCGNAYYIVRSCHEKVFADKLIDETLSNGMEIDDLIKLAYTQEEIKQIADGTFKEIENLHPAVLSRSKSIAISNKSE